MPSTELKAPLGMEIAGLIVLYNSFGSHVDDNGNAVDGNMEVQQAGEVLADI